MIRNLQTFTFQNFGTVLTEKHSAPSRANRLSMPVSEKDIILYQTTAETFLTFESGMPVLSVSIDGKSYQDFYLDRPVSLRRGIYFRLSAFQGHAAIQLSAISMPSLIETGPAEQLSVRGISRVSDLYTLFYHEKEQGFLFPGDSHPVFELTYVDSGSIHSVIDGQDLLMQQGDILICAPGQWHMHYADIGVAPCFVAITFSLDNWDHTCLTNRVFPANPRYSNILQQMLQEQESPGVHADEMLISLLTQLLVLLERQESIPARPSAALPVSNSENLIIQRAQQYITTHVREKLTVPDIARGIDVSASYLTALFNKHLQISPGEYLRRIKLQESKQMIREGNLNMTQIAAELQYSTIHHFSRQFKEKFGITPSEYAKSIR